MSTVLWANVLQPGGRVMSAEEDLAALYRHARRLDRLARRLALGSFEALCDPTDLQVNLGSLALPAGMQHTHELMARQGVWFEAAEAGRLLEGLARCIREENIRFGLLSNHHAIVLAELDSTRAFLCRQAGSATHFNFSVVT